ncbi:MAG: lipase family protein [Gordonia sp. (in: high G+C Gram-positive bacteria)]
MVLTIAGLAVAPGAAGASPPIPSQDPFYRPPADLAVKAPGTVLRTRVVQLGYRDTRLPKNATQVLYRTTDQFGTPSSTVTTIIRPANPLPGNPIISYHAFYDALGSQCDPSYTLRGGPSSSVPDLAIVAGYTAAGYTVVIPDYEGQKLRWTLGRESGQGALDGIRAAERSLRLPRSTRVGLFGYSGGSVPTVYAAALASKYAPELNLVGAAAGGVFVDPAHNLNYVDGSATWAGVIPALMTVYNEAYQLGLSNYLSPKGVRILNQVRGQCINQFAADYPGLTDHQLLRGGMSLLDVSGVIPAIRGNIPSNVGTPRIPLLLGQGRSDAVGDGVMVFKDVAGLAHVYCRRGVPTTFRGYIGKDHEQAVPLFAADAVTFLGDRFAGRAPTGCVGIPPGNQLTVP